MSYQLDSWYDARGRNRRPSGPIRQVKGLVGQVYFPTNKHVLDRKDGSVLDRLVRDVARTSRRERVELVMEGHADHRGASANNERLARKRANAVALYVIKRVPAKYFNTYSVFSLGERRARPNVSGDQRTAFDRRVDIWNSFGVDLPAFETARAVPRVVRLTKRVFVDVKGTISMSSVNAPDPISDLIDLAAEINDALDESVVRGRESPRSRHYRSFDARYRINAVSIEELYQYKIVTGGDLDTWTTTITYEWGPPRRLVAVNVRRLQRLPTDSSPKRVSEEKSLFRRSRVEKSPLLNPPPVKNVRF